MSPQPIALVTGANKGIGLETTRQLAQKGYAVVLAARDAAKGEAAAARLRDEGLAVTFVQLDATDEKSIARAVKEVEAKFGHLDALVNNAGIALDFGTPATKSGVENWRRTFDVNLFGVVTVTDAFLPLIKKSSAGRIVHLTSILGSLALASDPKSPIGSGTGTGAAYGASKAAINMYTVHLARELAPLGIKVNAAHPGWVKTDMGGASAPMELPDGAKTSVALASLPSDGPTGQFMHLGKTLPW